MVKSSQKISRRSFLKISAAAAASAAFSASPLAWSSVISGSSRRKPNILLITTDQQGMDTISAGGCKGVFTPNLDRLAARGVMFTESYCTNPVCSPARGSIYTGRACSETGVYKNQLPIRDGMASMGHIFTAGGYESVYCGKWHVPMTASMQIPGFYVMPGIAKGQGTFCDAAISRASENFLHTYKGKKPFLLAVNFLQPHDMCNWVGRHHAEMSELPYPELAEELPPLPPNFEIPEVEAWTPWRHYTKHWTKLQWRYYIWSYYRMVEEVDAEIGRVLDALEHSGHADDTVVIFTSDHGEGRGRHQTTQKNFLYDAATKVPFIISWPGQLPQGQVNTDALVSGVDVLATCCDCAGLDQAENIRGKSVFALASGEKKHNHEFVVADAIKDKCRMIRSQRYKLITVRGSSTLQMFDMKNDPNEMNNLAYDSAYARILHDHADKLNKWEASLERAPNVPGDTFRLNI